MLVNHGPSQQSCKEEYKSWKWVLAQDTMRLIQRPCYQRGSLCQDPAGNWTTWRPPGHRKEMQTAVVCTHAPFIRADQNHSYKVQWKGEEDKAEWERGRKKRGRKTISGNGQAWSSPSPRGQWRTEKSGGNWFWSHLWCLYTPWLRDRWRRWCSCQFLWLSVCHILPLCNPSVTECLPYYMFL